MNSCSLLSLSLRPEAPAFLVDDAPLAIELHRQIRPQLDDVFRFRKAAVPSQARVGFYDALLAVALTHAGITEVINLAIRSFEVRTADICRRSFRFQFGLRVQRASAENTNQECSKPTEHAPTIAHRH